ncbi:MAG: hypothetical protein ACTTKX_08250, partial [Treponema sp.]
SGSNKMKSFEISIVCAQARFRLRAVSSEKLDCGWRVCIANSVVSAADGASPKAYHHLNKSFKTRHST